MLESEPQCRELYQNEFGEMKVLESRTDFVGGSINWKRPLHGSLCRDCPSPYLPGALSIMARRLSNMFADSWEWQVRCNSWQAPILREVQKA